MSKMSLAAVAKKYNTDKGENGHNYIPYYEKHLPEKVNKFLEIGVWKGDGIRMFKEYYQDKGMFYGMDLFTEGYGLITPEELQALGINHFKGSQSNGGFLDGIKEKFTVIVDDASHHSFDQIVTFQRMFLNNLEDGGVYVCEDTHGYLDAYWRRGEVNTPEDTLYGVCLKYLAQGSLESQWFSRELSDKIISRIESVHCYDNKILFIKKTNDKS